MPHDYMQDMPNHQGHEAGTQTMQHVAACCTGLMTSPSLSWVHRSMHSPTAGTATHLEACLPSCKLSCCLMVPPRCCITRLSPWYIIILPQYTIAFILHTTHATIFHANSWLLLACKHVSMIAIIAYLVPQQPLCLLCHFQLCCLQQPCALLPAHLHALPQVNPLS